MHGKFNNNEQSSLKKINVGKWFNKLMDKVENDENIDKLLHSGTYTLPSIDNMPAFLANINQIKK